MKSEYHRIRFNNKLMPLHRVVFFQHYGWWPDEVDHIDGNRYNNSIENLRAVDHFQNTQNARLRKDSTTKIKGVSWHQKSQKWRVQVRCNKVRVCDKYMEDIELAELVAIMAREKYHGVYARHH